MPARRASPKKKGKKTGFFTKAVLAVNILIAGMLLLAYMAPVINPKTFWPVSFFGLAYPFLLFANVFFVLYWLISKPKFALISALCVLVGWSYITKTIGFRSQTGNNAPKSSENMIRVLTYNVHYFQKFDAKRDTATKQQMLDLIANEKPDILCIQEFFTRQKGVYNFKKILKETTGLPYLYFESSSGNDFEKTGLAILSRYPIINQGHIVFPNTGSGNEAIFADVKYKKKLVRVYCLHLQSINFQPEDYEYLSEVKQINTNVESSKRIGSRLKQAFIKRSEQVHILKEHAAKWNAPLMVCGDFNDTPVSYAVNYMEDGMQNAFQEKGSGFGITYNGDFPNFQIDYILASPQFLIRNYRVIGKKLSDHYAVRSDLELK